MKLLLEVENRRASMARIRPFLRAPLLTFPQKGYLDMGLIAEFKEFALKGNVVDMAVGVVIGGAFGKIISSLVSDIIMPAVGVVTGGVDFGALKYELKSAAEGSEAVYLNYGQFINTAIDFLIIAAAIFLAVKVMNSIKKAEEAAPKKTPEDIELLREIRDNLKK